MKKYLILLVALAMVLGLSGIAMAAGGPLDPTTVPPTVVSDTIPVTATVGSYAAITSIDGIALTFSGAANEIVAGTDTINVERNRSVNVGIVTTLLTLTGGTDTITTSVSPVSTDLVGRGSSNIDVEVTGTTGAISAQAAGDYAGVVTITVSAI